MINNNPDPIESLAKHGKSFYWASYFLSKTQKSSAAMLYSFCRFLDDRVDESASRQEAIKAIKMIRQALHTQKSHEPAIYNILSLIASNEVNINVVEQLVDGVAYDIEKAKVQTEDELIRYCYGVASTVGLLMCQVMGVYDKLAWRYAIDLGVAMQLTNISRDVVEDARHDRVYLPASMFSQSINAQDILCDPSVQLEAAKVIKHILQIADTYYRSADQGLCYLPGRVRMSILVASSVYEAIGKKASPILEDKYWSGIRVYTSKPHKIFLTSKSIIKYMVDPKLKYRNRGRAHDNALHRSIEDLVQHAFH